MGTEAQKLITVSLEKIATFRRRRREMSLHKNLLVTTVIHKARIAIMEETYYMYAAAAEGSAAAPGEYAPPPTYGCPQPLAAEAGMDWEGARAPPCEDEEAEDDKENLAPPRGHKRPRAGAADDEASPQKRGRWDEEAPPLLEEDADDDTSHALRLVSVLMSGAAAAMPSSGMAALRLVRSFSNPELSLCSKQAKEGCKEIRTMMDSCCSARAPLAIAV